jgi:hypothetical protein
MGTYEVGCGLYLRPKHHVYTGRMGKIGPVGAADAIERKGHRSINEKYEKRAQGQRDHTKPCNIMLGLGRTRGRTKNNSRNRVGNNGCGKSQKHDLGRGESTDARRSTRGGPNTTGVSVGSHKHQRKKMEGEAEDESQEIARSMAEVIAEAEGALSTNTELRVHADHMHTITNGNAKMPRRGGSTIKRERPVE